MEEGQIRTIIITFRNDSFRRTQVVWQFEHGVRNTLMAAVLLGGKCEKVVIRPKYFKLDVKRN